MSLQFHFFPPTIPCLKHIDSYENVKKSCFEKGIKRGWLVTEKLMVMKEHKVD
jgi:hypothetical protein